MNSERLLNVRGPLNREHLPRLLLISIVLFFALAPFLEGREVGAVLLILNLYVTLVVATMALKRIMFWSAMPIAGTSIVLLALSHFYPTPLLLLANAIALTAFLILVSASLFAQLGETGQITSDRIYISVSLYFLLALTWFAIYNLIDLVQTESFAEGGVKLTGRLHWSTILYFSLATLTTLGYGDVVAVKPGARMIATLEAAAGVLYVAITIARLVANQQSRRNEDKK